MRITSTVRIAITIMRCTIRMGDEEKGFGGYGSDGVGWEQKKKDLAFYIKMWIMRCS